MQYHHARSIQLPKALQPKSTRRAGETQPSIMLTPPVQFTRLTDAVCYVTYSEGFSPTGLSYQPWISTYASHIQSLAIST